MGEFKETLSSFSSKRSVLLGGEVFFLETRRMGGRPSRDEIPTFFKGPISNVFKLLNVLEQQHCHLEIENDLELFSVYIYIDIDI